MARIFIDDFESGNVRAWDVIGPNMPIVSGAITGMDGTYCARAEAFGFQGSFLYKVVPSRSEYYISFKYKLYGGYVYGEGVINFYNGTTSLARLYHAPGSYQSNRMAFYAGPTSDVTIWGNGTYLFEIYYKPHNTEGVFQVKCDGYTILEGSGDTTNSATTIDGILFGDTDSATGMYLSDVVIDDSEWPGNTRMQSIRPTNQGTTSQWTPEIITNDNYECVDDIPANSSDYVYTNTINKTDLYTMSNLVGDIGTVRCIQPRALVKSVGNHIPQNIQLVVRTIGTNDYSSNKTPPIAYRQLYDIWEVNPVTNDPWQDTEINSIEVGIKSVA